ncbi:Na+/H+ antiporter NhaC family protein [Vibrio sinensis]|uniref:Na+/H+ antiporter NhaC family protein n=1 Tax=Vibrio sinensis TaxID=2302434 RepID=A0A3A6QV46_9VIBR|nr:Na+/H+ antiporter NhaC family protein [Vibrio sinensis]RJX75198.1 Na+/H+ antiporter NhaC family protein [Vibrio sinensis]
MKNKPNFWGLSPIIIFLVLITVCGFITGGFTSMPLLVAFMLATICALAMNPKDEKLSLSEKLDIFCRESGDATIVLMVIVFLLAGAFYSIVGSIGAVESTVNFGLSLISSDYLLVGLFLIACFISFSIGTSMGTIVALAPIAIEIADQSGVSRELALGTLIGGGLFGDNLSFISDTTIAAVRTQSVEMRDKFKFNLLIVLPAVIITCVVVTLMSMQVNKAIIEGGEFDLLLLLPYLTVIVSALLGINVIAVLCIGIFVGCLIGLLNNSFTLVEMFTKLQQGMGWMQDLAIIALIVGGIVGLMNRYGGIQWLLESISNRIKSKRGAEYGIAFLVSTLDVATTNNTIAIVTAGPIAKKLGNQFDLDPRRIASLLDIFAAGFQGLIPYGGQYLAVAGLAAISPIAIVPYAFYPMLILVMGLISIAFGFPKFPIKQTESKQAILNQ